MKKKDNFEHVVEILKDLNKKFPKYNMLRHIADSTEEYTHIWGIEDGTLLDCLVRYRDKLYLPEQSEISKIIDEGNKIGNNHDFLYEEEENLE